LSYPRGNLSIPGPAGAIECIVREAAPGAPWAVVSHPHPRFGGTMHNKIVYRTAKALLAAGFNAIRYNFRGVGNSEGSWDEGRGEADDLRAVLAYLEAEKGRKRFFLAGFSFGSWIGARVGCGDPRVPALLHVGLPVNRLDLDFLWSCPKPTAVVQGDADESGAWDRLVDVVSPMPSARIFRVEGAGHFFEGKLPELERALADAIAWLDPDMGEGSS
jgi:uncharacterized protein